MCSWVRELKKHHIANVVLRTNSYYYPVFMLSIVQESVVRALSIVYVVACELFQLQHN